MRPRGLVPAGRVGREGARCARALARLWAAPDRGSVGRVLGQKPDGDAMAAATEGIRGGVGQTVRLYRCRKSQPDSKQQPAFEHATSAGNSTRVLATGGSFRRHASNHKWCGRVPLPPARGVAKRHLWQESAKPSCPLSDLPFLQILPPAIGSNGKCGEEGARGPGGARASLGRPARRGAAARWCGGATRNRQKGLRTAPGRLFELLRGPPLSPGP